jgi:hypothetical protein
MCIKTIQEAYNSWKWILKMPLVVSQQKRNTFLGTWLRGLIHVFRTLEGPSIMFCGHSVIFYVQWDIKYIVLCLGTVLNGSHCSMTLEISWDSCNRAYFIGYFVIMSAEVTMLHCCSWFRILYNFTKYFENKILLLEARFFPAVYIIFFINQIWYCPT